MERRIFMLINNVKCLSLGVVEKQAGEYQGKATPAYTALNYVVMNESASRRAYLDESALKSAALRICGEWGKLFKISGEISEKGTVKISDISEISEKDDFPNF